MIKDLLAPRDGPLLRLHYWSFGLAEYFGSLKYALPGVAFLHDATIGYEPVSPKLVVGLVEGQRSPS